MKILVTGGCGFIGSHLVDRLIEGEHEVVVVDDLSGGYTRNLNEEARLYRADLRNYNTARTIFESFRPKVVYHLASNAAESKAQFSPYEICTRNIDPFLALIGPALNNGMEKIIFTSSIAVYGDQEAPYSEELEPEPEDLYGISKVMVERSLEVLSQVHGFKYVITRPHNVYGPRQDMADPYRNVVTIWMNSILRDETYYIYGDGEQKRCFTYIDGVADALFRCLGVGAGTFNIGSDKAYTLNELSKAVMEVTGFDREPIYLPEREQEFEVATASHEKAKARLGHKEEVSLKEGIERTWKYAKELGPQKLRKTAFEIESEKIPDNWK